VVKELFKNLGEFCDKKTEGWKFMKYFVWGESLYNITKLIVDCFAIGQPKYDPYMEKLNELQRQMSDIQTQISNGLQFISDHLQKAEAESERDNLLSAMRHLVDDEGMLTNIRNATYAMVDIMKKNTIHNGTLSQYDQWLSMLYHTQTMDEKGKIMPGEFTYLSEYKRIGTLITGEDIKSTKNGYDLYEMIKSFTVNFNTETFTARQNNMTVYKSFMDWMESPLFFAIMYDFEKNMSIREGLIEKQNEFKAKLQQPLTDLDKNNIQDALDNFLEPRIRLAEMNIIQDKQYLGCKNADQFTRPGQDDFKDNADSSYNGDLTINITANMKIATNAYDKSKKKIDEEKKAADDKGVIYAYRIEKNVCGYLRKNFNDTHDHGLQGFAYYSTEHPENLNEAKEHGTGSTPLNKEELEKMVQASSTYFREDGKTHTNFYEELVNAGFRQGYQPIPVGDYEFKPMELKLTDFTSGKATVVMNDTMKKQLSNYLWGFHHNSAEWTTRYLDKDGKTEKYDKVLKRSSTLYNGGGFCDNSWEDPNKIGAKDAFYLVNVRSDWNK
jgi:hypothetical protein